MPRQLKILKGIIEEDPSIIRNKISALLGETVETAKESLKQLSICLHLLLEKDRTSAADQSIFDLGVRFWNDTKVVNLLVYEGLILHALMVQRDCIEIMIVAEYLHTYPQEAKDWQKAQTKKENRRFSINLLKDKVKDGKEWKDIWDDWSSYLHPNSMAIPAYARDRPFFGYNLYLGSFYDPGPIATIFSIQLAICIKFLEEFMDWYKDTLPFPAKFAEKLDALNQTYHEQIDKLKKRSDEEQQQIDDNIKATRFSKEEIIKMFQFLDTLP